MPRDDHSGSASFIKTQTQQLCNASCSLYFSNSALRHVLVNRSIHLCCCSDDFVSKFWSEMTKPEWNLILNPCLGSCEDPPIGGLFRNTWSPFTLCCRDLFLDFIQQHNSETEEKYFDSFCHIWSNVEKARSSVLQGWRYVWCINCFLLSVGIWCFPSMSFHSERHNLMGNADCHI